MSSTNTNQIVNRQFKKLEKTRDIRNPAEKRKLEKRLKKLRKIEERRAGNVNVAKIKAFENSKQQPPLHPSSTSPPKHYKSSSRLLPPAPAKLSCSLQQIEDTKKSILKAKNARQERERVAKELYLKQQQQNEEEKLKNVNVESSSSSQQLSSEIDNCKDIDIESMNMEIDAMTIDDMNEWTDQHVYAWMNRGNKVCRKYASIFWDNGIDGSILQCLSHKSLSVIGNGLLKENEFHRQIILDEISKQFSSPSADKSSSSSSPPPVKVASSSSTSPLRVDAPTFKFQSKSHHHHEVVIVDDDVDDEDDEYETSPPILPTTSSLLKPLRPGLDSPGRVKNRTKVQKLRGTIVSFNQISKIGQISASVYNSNSNFMIQFSESDIDQTSSSSRVAALQLQIGQLVECQVICEVNSCNQIVMLKRCEWVIPLTADALLPPTPQYHHHHYHTPPPYHHPQNQGVYCR